MSQPPSYEDTVGECDAKYDNHDVDSKVPQRFSIRDEVGSSRSQHVTALISKLLPQIRERAKSGLSKTVLLLLPSDQGDASKRGELVGFPEDDRPILIQLEGRYDGTQFWTQREALDLLKEQMLMELGGAIPAPAVEQTPPPPPIESQPKSSFWTRKQSKAPEARPITKQPKPPVTVDVEMDQVNFRTETEYGLFETIRGRAVLVTVDVR
ncbi:hypothetical protein M409DRAFT_16073 [Zasmidium cellare ATCC 36951]|uniref:Uncharacterized protein n=1 Tax=Zasmidium cellare ATCC 36951 TaxID=1080233 RepID=A0A6A6D6F2_ZASCE|nr:uncharacterized protein M409DRAFT_16073 [Zasmidium cellare ATCC 36951]KAF2173802.1 hypothetical protein M409DRAFT_16073 [Zasmidium cellare ATCC 36951]